MLLDKTLVAASCAVDLDLMQALHLPQTLQWLGRLPADLAYERFRASSYTAFSNRVQALLALSLRTCNPYLSAPKNRACISSIVGSFEDFQRKAFARSFDRCHVVPLMEGYLVRGVVARIYKRDRLLGINVVRTPFPPWFDLKVTRLVGHRGRCVIADIARVVAGKAAWNDSRHPNERHCAPAIG